MELSRENHEKYRQLKKNYDNAFTTMNRVAQAQSAIRTQWWNKHIQREGAKTRARQARFMSRNYLNALKNFALANKEYTMLSSKLRNMEAKRLVVNAKTLKAFDRMSEFTRRIPGFTNMYERNRNRAARTIQSRVLNRRAMRVIRSLEPLPRNISETIARSVLRHYPLPH